MSASTTRHRPMKDYINVKVDADTLARLDRAVEAWDGEISKGTIVRSLVRAWLDGSVSVAGLPPAKCPR